MGEQTLAPAAGHTFHFKDAACSLRYLFSFVLNLHKFVWLFSLPHVVGLIKHLFEISSIYGSSDSSTPASSVVSLASISSSTSYFFMLLSPHLLPLYAFPVLVFLKFETSIIFHIPFNFHSWYRANAFSFQWSAAKAVPSHGRISKFPYFFNFINPFFFSYTSGEVYFFHRFS